MRPLLLRTTVTLSGALAFLLLSARPGAAQSCLGDCSDDVHVTVDEVTTGVRLALGEPAEACPAFDPDGDGKVDVVDVVTAIDNVLHGCRDAALEREREENLAKWQAAGIDDYEIDYRRSCFCPPPSAVRILVRDGVVVSVRDADSGEEVEDPVGGPFGFNSVDELFESIADVIEQRVFELSVEYDAELGYPKAVSVDYYEDVADDTVSTRIDALRPLRE